MRIVTYLRALKSREVGFKLKAQFAIERWYKTFSFNFV
jgi:hypothetical protein